MIFAHHVNKQKWREGALRGAAFGLTLSLTLAGSFACARRANVQDSKLKLSQPSGSETKSSRQERIVNRSGKTEASMSRKTKATTLHAAGTVPPVTNPPPTQAEPEKTTAPPAPETKATPAPETPPAPAPEETKTPAPAPAPNPAPAPAPAPAESEKPAPDGGEAPASVPETERNTDDVIVADDSDSTPPSLSSENETTSFVLEHFVTHSLADLSKIEVGAAGASLKLVSGLVNFVESWPKDLQEILGDPHRLSEAASQAVANLSPIDLEHLKESLPVFYKEAKKLLEDQPTLERLAKDAGVELPKELPSADKFDSVVKALAKAANLSLDPPLPSESADNAPSEVPDSSVPETDGTSGT